MVAASARAWAMRRSAGSKGRGTARKRFSADGLVAHPHRQGIDRAEPGLGGGGREPWPPCPRLSQVTGGDGVAAAEAIQARSLVVLDLEQLGHAGRLAGRRRDPQLAARIGEHDPGRGRGRQGDAAVGDMCRESMMSTRRPVSPGRRRCWRAGRSPSGFTFFAGGKAQSLPGLARGPRGQAACPWAKRGPRPGVGLRAVRPDCTWASPWPGRSPRGAHRAYPDPTRRQRPHGPDLPGRQFLERLTGSGVPKFLRSYRQDSPEPGGSAGQSGRSMPPSLLIPLGWRRHGHSCASAHRKHMAHAQACHWRGAALAALIAVIFSLLPATPQLTA